MIVPEFPDVRRLVLPDYPRLAETLGLDASPLCDLVPANLFIWRDSEQTSITRVGDSLCILVEPRSQPAYFLEPVGGCRPVDAVRTCLTRVDRVSRAGRRLVETLPLHEFEVRPLRDYYDYVYRREVLVELKGKDFDGKRNRIRKFAQSCPDHEFRILDRNLFGTALALFDRWAERQQGTPGRSDSPASLDPGCQRSALERAFEAFGPLGLVGGAMFVRGDMQGFIVASATASGNGFVHFQYANAEIPGIYQVLLRDACRLLFAGCTYLNLEEDLGVPGLRTTKLSYHPVRLEHKYEIGRPEARHAVATSVAAWRTALPSPHVGL